MFKHLNPPKINVSGDRLSLPCDKCGRHFFCRNLRPQVNIYKGDI